MAAIASVAFIQAERLRAATLTYCSPDGFGGQWNDPSRWCMNVNGQLQKANTVPGPGDTAIVNEAVDASGSITVAGLQLTDNASLRGGTFTVTDLILKSNPGGAGTLLINCTITVGGTFNVTGPNNTLNGVTINNNGTITLAGITSAGQTVSSTLTLFGSRPTIINNSGTFKLGDGGSIAGKPDSAINNTGTVQGVGSDTSPPSIEILTFNNNGGTVQVDSGTLRFISCVANSTGPFNVTSTDASLVFDMSKLNLQSGAAISGSGFTRAVDSTTVNVNANVAVDHFELQGASVLDGAGDFTVTAIFRWTGAGILKGSGKLVVDVNSGLRLESGSEQMQIRRTILNKGTATWISGGIQSSDGPSFENMAGATFDVQVDSIWSAAGTNQFNNAGIFVKSKGDPLASATRLAIDFNNTKTVDVQAGSLRLAGGASAGNFKIAKGSTLVFASGTHTLKPPANFTGDGFTRVESGGTTILNGSFANSISAQNFELVDGVIDGPGTLRITGTFNWGDSSSGGIKQGSGAISIDGATMNIRGPRTKSFRQGDIVNFGAVNWTDNGTFEMWTGATFSNTGGTFNALGDGFCTWGSGTNPPVFINTGTFNKVAGTGATTFEVDFNNLGTVSVSNTGLTAGQTRRVSFSGGSSTGPATGKAIFDAAAGTSVRFFRGTYTVNAGTVFTGDGFASILGGNLLVNGNVSATKVELGTNPSDNSDGTLDGPGTLTVGKAFEWTAGTMQGSGITDITPDAKLNISGSAQKKFLRRTIQNSGAAILSGTGDINAGDGALFINRAVGSFDFQSDAGFFWTTGTNQPVFNNVVSGKVRKSDGVRTSFFLGVQFNNDGNVDVQHGILGIVAPEGASSGTSGGVFNTSEAFAQIGFSRGIHTLNSGAKITGPGQIGTLIFPGAYGGGTVFLKGDVSAETFSFEGGALDGPGTMSVSQRFEWGGGQFLGTGSLNIDGAAKLEIRSDFVAIDKKIQRATINNAGSATWTGGGRIRMGNGAVFNNSGTFDAQNDSTLESFGAGTTPAFNNTGIFKKSDGTNSTVIGTGVIFNNKKTVSVLKGTLAIYSNGDSLGGTFDAASGAAVIWKDGAYNLVDTRITGPGSSGVDGGDLVLYNTVTAQNFFLASGKIERGDLDITESFRWTGGALETMSGARLTIRLGATLILDPRPGPLTQKRPIYNDGDAIWLGSGNRILTDSRFNNDGTFDAKGDSTFSYLGTERPLFNNGGTFIKSAGTNKTLIDLNFQNSGKVLQQSGTLSLYGPGFSQTAEGVLDPGGATIEGDPGMKIDSGKVVGTGTLKGSITLAGRTSPGHSPGILQIDGDYTQTPAGSLDIEIGGFTPGQQHDQLKVSGTATLGGSLNVKLISGFMPQAGDSFQILTYGSRNGTFPVKNGINLGNGIILMPDYRVSGLVLVATNVTLIQPRMIASKAGGPVAGLAQFAWDSVPSQPYQIEFSTNLIDWFVLTNITATATSTVFSYPTTDPNFLIRFYRLR